MKTSFHFPLPAGHPDRRSQRHLRAQELCQQGLDQGHQGSLLSGLHRRLGRAQRVFGHLQLEENVDFGLPELGGGGHGRQEGQADLRHASLLHVVEVPGAEDGAQP